MTDDFSGFGAAPPARPPSDADFLPPGWNDQPSPPPHPPQWPPGSPPGRRRRLSPMAAVAIVVGVAVGAAAVAIPVVLLTRSSSSSGSAGSTAGGGTPPTQSTSTAQTAFQQAIAATRASNGFHYVAQTSGGGDDQKIVGDAAKDGGKQVITVTSTYGAEQFTLLLVNSTVYFQGNSPALQDQLGVPASSAEGLQNTWISLVSTDGPYTVLAPGITVNDQAQETILTPKSVSQVTESDGTQAMRISGAVPSQQGAPPGTGHLDVAVNGHLPITYATSISGASVTITSTVTFSAWGTAPTVSAPASPTAWSTLGASQPPGGYGSGGAAPGSSPTPGSF